MEEPVFFDPKGRRARLVGVVGAGLGAAAMAALALLITGSIGFATIPALGSRLHLVTRPRPSANVQLARREEHVEADRRLVPVTAPAGLTSPGTRVAR